MTSSAAPERARRGSGTLASLSVRNYRLYFFGQMVSLSGTWMQGIAQAWLVLKITGSGTSLGFVSALSFLPVLVFGPWGGVIADRFAKRRVLVITQILSAFFALVLGLLVATDRVHLWEVYVLASALGFVNVVDMPTRQTFVLEMVGREQLTNAVSVNTVMVNVARIIGPAVAGVLIATVGLGTCFLLNAASFGAMIVALALMHGDDLEPAPPQPRTPGQLREGFLYVRRTPELLAPLLMMGVIGTLAFEFQVILPLVARFTFHGDAGTYGWMSTCMGAGAVVGGLLVASRGRHAPTALGKAAIVFGAFIVVAAVAPNLATEMAALVLVGGTSVVFLALGNATLQLAAEPAMRGRVMSLWTVAFVGSTPIGGPIVGWVGEHAGPRWGLVLGGVATMLAGALTYRSLVAIEREKAEAPEPELLSGPRESLAERG